MPDTVDTVIWAADGWGYRPKHVERFVDVNKLYIVASCWMIIDTYFRRTLMVDAEIKRKLIMNWKVNV